MRFCKALPALYLFALFAIAAPAFAQPRVSVDPSATKVPTGPAQPPIPPAMGGATGLLPTDTTPGTKNTAPSTISSHTPLPLAPPSAHGGAKSARVAITEFHVVGESASPALSMQLQDGFVVGLTRTTPVYVLDSVDVARYIDTFPELQKCDGSICVKRFGQLLDVSHLIRISVKVSGNSYTMTARLLSTEEQTPALVPIETETRFCNVCTVDEARQKMVQLGDALKRPVEAWLDQWRPAPPPPPPPKSWRRPLAAVGVAVGFATAVAGGALFANAQTNGGKWWAGIGGAMFGVGVSATVLGCYVFVALPSEPGKPAASLALAGRF